jgi:STE24 endopeptidase
MCLELPSFLLSAGLLVVVGLVVGFLPWGVLVIGVWLASGPVILLRRVEYAVMKGRENLRSPTNAERRRLAPLWQAVTSAAGADPRNYTLWVQKTRRINAFAAAGHTVAVTEAAVRALPDDLLEAVLAHELGHHLGGHAWASLLRYWYSLPAKYVFGFATSLSLALTSALREWSTPLVVAMCAVVVGALGYLVAVIPVVGMLAALFVVAPFGLLWASRAQEYEADAIAARLGYGAALSRFLISTTRKDKQDRSGWRYRIAQTHPSDPDRARRLHSQVLATANQGHEPRPG